MATASRRPAKKTATKRRGAAPPIEKRTDARRGTLKGRAKQVTRAKAMNRVDNADHDRSQRPAATDTPKDRIRDTFSMPPEDYGLIRTLKKRARSLGIEVKKSVVLRAGLAALNGMPDDAFGQAMSRVASAKRPTKNDEKSDVDKDPDA